MEEFNEQRRVVCTPPPGSPTFPVSRRPRSPARRRACSREQRSRSRSSRQSRGRPSRCSPEQPNHRSQEELVRRTRSRSNRLPSSNQLSNPVRLGSNRTVCLYAHRDSVRSDRVGRSRSRSRLRDHSRGRSPEQNQDRNRCRDRSHSHGRDPDHVRHVSNRHTDLNRRPRTSVDPVTDLRSRLHTSNPSRMENDGFLKPNSGLAKLVDTLLAANINSLNKFSSMNNTVPEFDPSRREQTMAMWLHKVNECAIIYGWSESQLVHFALPKLKGLAQRWYESLPSVLHSWEEWQQKLLSAFPSEENYGQMLSEMLAKRARFTDSLEDYFYSKVALLNRCGITGKRAVECVIHGIDDRSVKLGAEAAQYSDPDKLLSYLRNAKSTRQNNERKFVRGPTNSRNNDNIRSTNRPLRCTNCKNEGHITSQCTQPLKKCGRCNRIGHETDQCYAKMPAPEKTVMKISNNIENPAPPLGTLKTSAKFFKEVSVDNILVKAFLDFGSECTMMKISEFSRLNSTYDPNDLPVLRGFGNSTVKAIGRKLVRLIVDDVEADVELFIVPDNVMNIPLLIGQSFTEQPHVIIRKTSESLEVSSLSQSVENSRKINIFTKSKVKLNEFTVIDIYTEPSLEADVYVEGGLRYYHNKQYCVPTGLFHIGQEGTGKLAVRSTGSNITLPGDLLIARGVVAHLDKERQMIINMCSTDKPLKPIQYENIKCGDALTHDDKIKLLALLNNFRHCFANDLSELGKSVKGEMVINLTDETPVVYRPYRLAITEKEKVRDIISNLLDNDIIRLSTSPYASPIVLVRKKSNDFRLCIDYRALNKKTIKDNYPLPLIDDQLDVLAGNKFYTTLDLTSGYYQIPIRESDRYKTGFVTPDGHYEFNRMPFGLANAPATFQRIMNQILGSARHKDALAYLDDVIIPSKDVAEGMLRLESILNLFSAAGLTLNISKCSFFGHTVDYLGFEITADGIRPGSKKSEAVEKFPVPQNQHNIRQFLGLASFFRRFVPGFSMISKPLTKLLKKDVKWCWGQDQENAFRNLQKQLSQKPTLALYDPKAQTELHTDACKIGVAGILMQKSSSNLLQPVAYFSRQTTPEEQNYSSYDLETLAVVEALRKFRVYLVGAPFKIVTDCNSLRATFSKRDMVPRVARWWQQMQEYDFNIEYKPGKSMAHVDALSRNPISSNIQEIKDVLNVNADWLVTVQESDEEVRKILGILENSEFDHITDIKSNYKEKNGKLFRITKEGDRWVVPKGVRWQIVKQNHDDIGHFAVDKTLEKIKASYWFPDMRKFVTKYVNSCLECAYCKTSGGKKPGFLHPIEKVDKPFDTIHADHVGPFVRSSKGNMYILVMIDSFTRYLYLKAVRNTKSSTSIKVFKEYFGSFGVPRRLITDRGTSFNSKSFRQFMLDKNIKHILNAVSTPRANGQVERYNRTLIESLATKTVGSSEKKWDEYLPEVQWGINNTHNKGINCTPSEALFGTRPMGSSDSRIVSEISDDITHDTDNQSIDEIRKDINNHVSSYQTAQKVKYDEKRCAPRKYNIGDLVRVERQIPATGNSRKLIPKYQGPYKITEIYDHDRYQIQDTPITRKGNKRYTTVVAVDKIKPWLNFVRPHDISV